MTRWTRHHGGAMLLAVAILVAVVLGGASLVAVSRRAHLGPETLRDPRQPIAGDMAILLDASDQVDSPEVSALELRLKELCISGLAKNERVTLWVIDRHSAGTAHRAFQRFFPGREMDEIFHNPKRAERRLEEGFTAPLLSAVRRATSQQEAPRTYLLEGLAVVGEQWAVMPRSSRRRLMVVSNLDQNSPRLSLLRGVPQFSEPLAASGLHGVDVSVFYLAPRSVESGAELRRFWRAYFAANGAHLIEFEQL